MGDMADMLIEQGFDMMLDGECDPYDGGYSEPRTVCKFCKKRELHWEETGSGWRLFNSSGVMHSCNSHKAKPAIRRTPELQRKLEGQAIANRCPHCGDEYGMSFGTGDCDCADGYEEGIGM